MVKRIHGAGRGTTVSYLFGFILSLELTLAAYFLVVNRVLESRQLILTIMGLGVAQLLVQLVFFLHLGRESKPRWNLTVFSFMALVLVVLVGGSLWIMSNLDYNTMTPTEIETKLLEEEAIPR
ncbi:cytochrome o ubiquinol oxidase subunit IV [Candidatus Saccharibacteria bacterium]|nr:cytochrome o ubiquinol oxidase subunit IV [Candidatus Saccharibacteria bacterium]